MRILTRVVCVRKIAAVGEEGIVSSTVSACLSMNAGLGGPKGKGDWSSYRGDVYGSRNLSALQLATIPGGFGLH